MINLESALVFAEKKHDGQCRAGGTPYVVHPVRVSEIVREVEKNSKERDILVAAALLHDTLEDTDTSYKEIEENFGRMAAGLVAELTSSPYACDVFGKTAYLSQHMCFMTPHALTIKLADRLDNISDMKGFPKGKRQKYFASTTEIIDYLEKNRTLNETHKQLIKRIKAVINKA